MAWPALCVAAAVLLLFGVAWGPGWTRSDAEALALPAQVGLAVQAVRRCPHCGWIESKREILPGVADPQAPQTYEYTLRMADGSSSVFQQALPTTWRLGERLVVIDGTGLLK